MRVLILKKNGLFPPFGDLASAVWWPWAALWAAGTDPEWGEHDPRGSVVSLAMLSCQDHHVSADPNSANREMGQ